MLTTAERDHLAVKLRKHLDPLIAYRLKQMGIDKPYEFYCKPEWDFERHFPLGETSTPGLL